MPCLRFRDAAILLLAGGLAAACTTERAAPHRPSQAIRGMQITGTLTGEGAECPTLRAADGQTYSLVGELAGFATGDRVIVEGVPQETSICMRGRTYTVLSIRRAA